MWLYASICDCERLQLTCCNVPNIVLFISVVTAIVFFYRFWYIIYNDIWSQFCIVHLNLWLPSSVFPWHSMSQFEVLWMVNSCCSDITWPNHLILFFCIFHRMFFFYHINCLIYIIPYFAVLKKSSYSSELSHLDPLTTTSSSYFYTDANTFIPVFHTGHWDDYCIIHIYFRSD